jgi:hypothetical protein
MNEAQHRNYDSGNHTLELVRADNPHYMGNAEIMGA